MAKVDVEWLQINLCLYVESFRRSSAAGETSGATGETSATAGETSGA